MASFSAIRADNAAFSPSYFPVALFVGGTSGIGQATMEAFARYTKGEAHIIICGRNRAAAESIIASFPKSSNGRYEFIACDVTLMKNVHATTTGLLSTLPKLNFLVLSTGFLNFNGRLDETSEGIDKKLAVDYYARWKLINDLMPLLQKAKDAGEDAKVMSVLAAGKGGPIDLDDLGLKKGYSLTEEMAASATYNDIMVDSFAARHPEIAFTHTYPGFVLTSIIRPDTWALRLAIPLWYCMTYFFSFSASQSGEYQLHSLLEGEKGSYGRGPKGQIVKRTKKNYFSTEEAQKKLWEHTVEVTKVD